MSRVEFDRLLAQPAVFLQIFVFMEFAGGGDLSGYVKKHKILKEELACVWFTQTSEAVHYLHTEARMAHRDIKLDNILLNDASEVKVCALFHSPGLCQSNSYSI